MTSNILKFVILFFMFFGCAHKSEETLTQKEETLKGVEISHIVYPNISFELKANFAEFIADDQLLLKDVKATRYLKKDKSVSFICSSGIFDTQTFNFNTIGPTTIVISQDDKIIAEDIVYNNTTGKIKSDKPVKRLKGGSLIKGDAFESDSDFSTIVIKNAVIVKQE